jgi:hypothetical protein
MLTNTSSMSSPPSLMRVYLMVLAEMASQHTGQTEERTLKVSGPLMRMIAMAPPVAVARAQIVGMIFG